MKHLQVAEKIANVLRYRSLTIKSIHKLVEEKFGYTPYGSIYSALKNKARFIKNPTGTYKIVPEAVMRYEHSSKYNPQRNRAFKNYTSLRKQRRIVNSTTEKELIAKEEILKQKFSLK